jgi:hypothetical protein
MNVRLNHEIVLKRYIFYHSVIKFAEKMTKIEGKVSTFDDKMTKIEEKVSTFCQKVHFFVTSVQI